jgi:hypothetical protein
MNNNNQGWTKAQFWSAIVSFGVILGIIGSCITIFVFIKPNPTVGSPTSPTQAFTPASIGTVTTPIQQQTSAPSPTPTQFVVTATSSSYVQLKSYYSGTASGYTDGSITFTLKNEDQQGNISIQTTFQQLGGSQKTAIYSCQGSVTTDNQISLQCINVSDPSYVLTVQGYVFPDGHMEGTETATHTNDASYNHVYSWKVY